MDFKDELEPDIKIEEEEETLDQSNDPSENEEKQDKVESNHNAENPSATEKEVSVETAKIQVCIFYAFSNISVNI